MTEPSKPGVTLVFTGGTISMGMDPISGGAVPMLSGEEILRQVPGLDRLARVSVVNFARLPGPHMTPARMLELARNVAALLTDEAVDGVVITHGTDTLEETAYLLHLVLSSIKPVVFVGAMRHSSEDGWDGAVNLRAAVQVAAARSARGLGVLVVMNNQLIAAQEATKTNTAALDTFQSRDFGPLGCIDQERVIIVRTPPLPQTIAATHLEERVEVIPLPAGSDGHLIGLALAAGAQGLVLEGLGRGNVPITALSEVENALRSGIPIVITSRCPKGRVLDTYAYPGAGKQLTRLGAILGGALPSHKARLKLMLLLGQGATLDAIRQSFASP